MKLITPEEMRELDRRTIESGIPGEELMFTAGEGLADAIRTLASNHQLTDSPVLFVAGAGNNGGDAFVAACCLHEDGWPVECWLAAPESKIKGDALIHFKKMKKAGVPFEVLDTSEHWTYVAESGIDAEIIVDGLLGTGAAGDPRGVIADAVQFIDAQADRALVVAIDIPSAMAIRADLTVTMGLPKIGLAEPENIDMVGQVEVVDIGIPPAFIDEAVGDADLEFIHPSDLSPLFPRRPRDAHKGAFGHVLCIGGSKGYSGAIAMASRAATRSGAGLVSAFVPEAIHALVAPAIPEVMVHSSMPEGKWTAIMAGCGMGRSATTREQVLHLLEDSAVPVVLDADAITVLADHVDSIKSAKCPVVLTPHPGEFAALFGLKVDDVQEDRFGMARMAADKLGATIVLKGAGTLVATPGQPIAINLTGNPGMAAGGSGDVLAGIIAGLVAQGIAPFEAACAGVWLHGRAGDLAAAEKAQASLIATDLIEKIPDAFRDISCR
ncbi:Bifunctional NAD(P)H-hydrate repair enzyme Nnr [Pontiella desulfatans]|uniref:Bifunctional NAD(P)H-hydrate repair enzyme n=1 Tax=Pontiella desulfatans TaxID=2750659 RepID=A0A6C2U6W7_PONDE|nr:NAD(P)H-hydrate dehydratase [Pontiella desulfatans]VGO15812.1 Bifunctional NAD(P)H-hydrate repair enzyme Nnr [Pontiella desulfatans]